MASATSARPRSSQNRSDHGLPLALGEPVQLVDHRASFTVGTGHRQRHGQQVRVASGGLDPTGPGCGLVHHDDPVEEGLACPGGPLQPAPRLEQAAEIPGQVLGIVSGTEQGGEPGEDACARRDGRGRRSRVGPPEGPPATVTVVFTS